MTNDELQAHLISQPGPAGMRYPAPRLVCNDGLSLSVQASAFHYCSPRSNQGPYTHVEVGFPNEYVTELEPYSDDGGSEVYAGVPVQLILDLIEQHGGLYGAV